MPEMSVTTQDSSRVPVRRLQAPAEVITLISGLAPVDEVGYLAHGNDAANVLFHVVNERHLKCRPIIFTTNKSPITRWGDVLHDPDLAEAIVDRTLERGQLLILDGPSYRTRHLPELTLDTSTKPASITGTERPEFPERAGLAEVTIGQRRVTSAPQQAKAPTPPAAPRPLRRRGGLPPTPLTSHSSTDRSYDVNNAGPGTAAGTAATMA